MNNTIPIKTSKNGGELVWSGRVNNSFTTCGTRRVTLVTNQVTSHELGKSRIVITTNGKYPRSFVTQILRTAKVN